MIHCDFDALKHSQSLHEHAYCCEPGVASLESPSPDWLVDNTCLWCTLYWLFHLICLNAFHDSLLGTTWDCSNKKQYEQEMKWKGLGSRWFTNDLHCLGLTELMLVLEIVSSAVTELLLVSNHFILLLSSSRVVMVCCGSTTCHKREPGNTVVVGRWGSCCVIHNTFICDCEQQ